MSQCQCRELREQLDRCDQLSVARLHEVHALRAKLEVVGVAAPAPAGWRGIESLPTDASYDVLWTDGRFVFCDPAECILSAHGEGTATHWMPLPEPPSAAAPSAPAPDSISSGTAADRTGITQCPTSAGEREAFEAAAYRLLRSHQDLFSVAQNIGHDWVTVDGPALDRALEPFVISASSQPARSYPLDLLGNPLVEYEPGKWCKLVPERQSEVAEQLSARLVALMDEPSSTGWKRLAKKYCELASDAIAALRGGRTTSEEPR